jgi:hypothetical protein
MFPLSVPCKGLETMIPPFQWANPTPKPWFLTTIFQEKEPSQEVDDSWAEQKKYKIILE